MKNTIVKDAIILFLITLIAGASLGAVHEITLEPIAQAQAEAAAETYQTVFPEAVTFETTPEITALIESSAEEIAGWGYSGATVDECLEARDASGAVLGYVVNASAKGYGGDVQISAGIDKDKKLLGIGFLSISETPGLGMKATEPAFTEQFIGKNAGGDIVRVKTGDANESQFNALSGATYTSTAVENALNAAIRFVNEKLS